MPAPQADIRILLVDDSPVDRELIARRFQDPAPLQGPVQVEVVADAEGALDAVRRASFSVILIDYSLPGRSGLDLLGDLREASHGTPVVMITGTGDESIAVTALQRGAADYVTKQLGFERALPVVVERVLRKTALDLAAEKALQSGAEYTRGLERQIEDQTRALQHALQESEALRRVGLGLASARELKLALDLVSRASAEIMQAQAAAAMIRSGPDYVLASTWGGVKQSVGLKRADLPTTLSTGWEVVASVPLRGPDGEIGVLWVGRSRTQPFSSHERELLETLAAITALSIENVRAHERLRRKSEGESPQPPGEKPTAAVSPPHVTHPPPTPIDPGRLMVPSFPSVLVRLIALAEDENASPDAVEEAIGLDPGLATRTIQLASVPALGRARPASSLREALLVLGLRTVRNLAFAIFARRLLVEHGRIAVLLSEQSLATAVGTQLVIETGEPAVADDAYLCGLLHNMGEMAVHTAHPDRYATAVQIAIAEERPLVEVETELFGQPAATVTAHLIKQWSLPPRVVHTLSVWHLEGSDPDPIAVAMRWARMFAWQSNPVWLQLLAGRHQPQWVTSGLAAAERQLGLPEATIVTVREQTGIRRAALARLVG